LSPVGLGRELHLDNQGSARVDFYREKVGPFATTNELPANDR